MRPTNFTVTSNGYKSSMIQDQNFIIADENGFRGSDLDSYLAAGYYRMQHSLFTTNFTQIDILKPPLPVFWLRTPVKNIIENKAVIALRKKCSAFKTTYKKATITREVDDLYEKYRQHITFEAGDSCGSYLHDSYFPNPFNAWMIEVHDNDILIAVGYFDIGKNTLAGILNFYHPAYKKYSLGKYLMLLKIDCALANDIEFYYTGYISTDTNKFDYKIFPDAKAIEVLLHRERQWVNYNLVGKDGLKAYVENKLFLY